MAKKLFITKKFKTFCKLLDSPLAGAIIIHLQGEKNVKKKCTSMDAGILTTKTTTLLKFKFLSKNNQFFDKAFAFVI